MSSFAKGPDLVFVQRRTAQRHRTYMQLGKLLTPYNTVLSECTIHDISATGARVELLVDALIPSRVRFFDAERGYTRMARLAWRDALAIGLKFGSSPTALSQQQIQDFGTKWDHAILAKIFMKELNPNHKD